MKRFLILALALLASLAAYGANPTTAGSNFWTGQNVFNQPLRGNAGLMTNLNGGAITGSVAGAASLSANQQFTGSNNFTGPITSSSSIAATGGFTGNLYGQKYFNGLSYWRETHCETGFTNDYFNNAVSSANGAPSYLNTGYGGWELLVGAAYMGAGLSRVGPSLYLSSAIPAPFTVSNIVQVTFSTLPTPANPFVYQFGWLNAGPTNTSIVNGAYGFRLMTNGGGGSMIQLFSSHFFGSSTTATCQKTYYAGTQYTVGFGLDTSLNIWLTTASNMTPAQVIETVEIPYNSSTIPVTSSMQLGTGLYKVLGSSTASVYLMYMGDGANWSTTQ